LEGEKRCDVLLGLGLEIKEIEDFPPLLSVGRMMSCSTTLSSRFWLRRVALDEVEILRERTLLMAAPISSVIPASRLDNSTG